VIKVVEYELQDRRLTPLYAGYVVVWSSDCEGAARAEPDANYSLVVEKPRGQYYHNLSLLYLGIQYDGQD